MFNHHFSKEKIKPSNHRILIDLKHPEISLKEKIIKIIFRDVITKYCVSIPEIIMMSRAISEVQELHNYYAEYFELLEDYTNEDNPYLGLLNLLSDDETIILLGKNPIYLQAENGNFLALHMILGQASTGESYEIAINNLIDECKNYIDSFSEKLFLTDSERIDYGYIKQHGGLKKWYNNFKNDLRNWKSQEAQRKEYENDARYNEKKFEEMHNREMEKYFKENCSKHNLSIGQN